MTLVGEAVARAAQSELRTRASNRDLGGLHARADDLSLGAALVPSPKICRAAAQLERSFC